MVNVQKTESGVQITLSDETARQIVDALPFVAIEDPELRKFAVALQLVVEFGR